MLFKIVVTPHFAHRGGHAKLKSGVHNLAEKLFSKNRLSCKIRVIELLLPLAARHVQHPCTLNNEWSHSPPCTLSIHVLLYFPLCVSSSSCINDDQASLNIKLLSCSMAISLGVLTAFTPCPASAPRFHTHIHWPHLLC